MATSSIETGNGRPEPVDADPARRPGVPMVGKRAEAEGQSLRALPQQEPTVEVLVGVEVPRLTPVFGTTLPPRGLSGILRRRAYAIPEHAAGRWMELMLADRVDVWESRMRRNPGLSALVLGALFYSGVRWATRRR